MPQLTLPVEPVLYYFYPTKDFFEESVQTQYITNMPYAVRDGNTKLDTLVQQWKKEGKVK